MSLTREEVASIAHLARIGLSDEELDRTGHELDSVLDYVNRLQRIDTDGVPEASALPVDAGAFRPDVVDACVESERALILQNFPASSGDLLKAPAVFVQPKS
ncbi:MAG: Asp-tRNA(Asn)/Glu-tRNA(Gln) amidotransferase subunit GatC [Candidatus Uhrbacteria bacterium]|nr:Asp-tRNA(Asn)/Glu-tRNA(Gln) amidotransferase subunit GatC [Candidatus Uhrbacteria bacterium]